MNAPNLHAARAGLLTQIAADACYWCNRSHFIRGQKYLRVLAEYLSPGKLCRVNRYGVRMDLYVGDTRKSIDRALLFHSWQPSTIALLHRVCRPGMVCIDIGANIGFISLLIGKLVGPSGRVYSFEPMPAFYERLVHHIAINGFDGRVVAEPFAASDCVSTATLFSNGATAAMGDVYKSKDTTGGVAINSVRVDDVLKGRKIDFIKIDTDGHEFAAIAGAGETIAAHRPVMLVEVYDTTLGSLARCEELIALLFSLGYRVFSEDETREYSSPEHAMSFGNQDVLCRPR